MKFPSSLECTRRQPTYAFSSLFAYNSCIDWNKKWHFSLKDNFTSLQSCCCRWFLDHIHMIILHQLSDPNLNKFKFKNSQEIGIYSESLNIATKFVLSLNESSTIKTSHMWRVWQSISLSIGELTKYTYLSWTIIDESNSIVFKKKILQ